MRKILSIVFCLVIGVAISAASPRPSPSKKNPKSGVASKPIAKKTRTLSTVDDEQPQELHQPAPEPKPAVIGDYIACMDDFCPSDMFPDKGRCRCSPQLPRIEKVLRDIEKAQTEADKQSSDLKMMMNVTNSAEVKDKMGNIVDNIASIEKKAKSVASNRIDSKTLAAEGLPLYNAAKKECEPEIAAMPKDDFDKKIKEYESFIEKDCGAYTTILKEKSDNISDLLTQTQKNREMFLDQQNKSRNQLDSASCRLEYEACIKNECGLNFKLCKTEVAQKQIIGRCEAANQGKCEDYKSVVIVEMLPFIKRESAKDDLAIECKSAKGWLENGRCMIKVIYAANTCKNADGCGDIAEIMLTPGSSVSCSPSGFKKLGHDGNCFILGPNNEKEPAAGEGGTVSVPLPKGWGADGYPKDKELRGTF